MSDRPYLYLAEVPGSGRALFRRLDDAKDWCDYQLHHRHPGRRVRWVSGGEHGWWAQRWEGRDPQEMLKESGTVTSIQLDETLPEYDDHDMSED